MNNPDYVIKGRFTGHRQGRRIFANEAVYLGPAGRWCPVEEALKFNSPMAGEFALQETWCKLRNAGDHSTILSVEKLPCGSENIDRTKAGT